MKPTRMIAGICAPTVDAVGPTAAVNVYAGAMHEMPMTTAPMSPMVPALTSSLCISTGGVNVQNAQRTVSAYESTCMERQELLGPLYKRAMSPMVSRVMPPETARRKNSRRRAGNASMATDTGAVRA